MIITENFFEIEDQTERLIQKILQSPEAVVYRERQAALYASPVATAKRAQFLTAKDEVEQMTYYGEYVPGFKEKQRMLRKRKRELDLDGEVAAYRLAETSLQHILDAVGLQVAKTVSEEIKVDAGNPFFESKGCRGNCHAS